MSQDDDHEGVKRQPTEPFDQPNYGQGSTSYGQGATPYGHSATPHDQGATPYGQGAQPYGQPPAPQPYGPLPYGQPYGPPPYGYGYLPPQRTNGLAIASMVLGIVWIYWIGSILALIFGYIAKKQIRERGQGGGGMATAGIVLGWVGIGFLVLFLVFGIAARSSFS